MSLYVDFMDSKKLTVKSVFFNNPPDPELYPNHGIIEEDDPRYADFLSSQKPTALELAESERDRFLAMASLRIAPLQNAVDLEEASIAETALLKKWKKYSVAVNRAVLSDDPVDWPVQPLS